MRRELYVSAGLHIALLLGVAFGDILFHRNTETDFQVTGVQIVSTAEFEELTQAASLPPAPEPAPEPAPDPAPQPEVQPQPPEISAPPLGAENAPPSDTPTPEATPRVAPTPAPAPPPDAEIAPTVVEATPEPDAQSETPVEQEVAQAPEAATTQIVTEAEKPAASLAPIASPVPTARPQRPTPEPTPEPEPQPEPEPAPEPADPLANAIAAAVADAVSAPATPSVPSGPPLSSGEVDGLIADVRACWNVGALSSDAQRTIVTISVTLGQDGRPDAGSIRMIDSSGGSDASVSQAFEAGRRAILRCGANGFNLPPEKYDQWQTIEMVFNPEQMRLR
ncbi:hypothetical protein [Roseobacter sp. HKCCD5988]|uniref:hypothetical protein n=1 Tax=Roseobacter sp. HKCCD5988 TaxID=3120338 RepID=UPI0030EEC16F